MVNLKTLVNEKQLVLDRMTRMYLDSADYRDRRVENKLILTNDSLTHRVTRE
jgi:hypothetical protein